MTNYTDEQLKEIEEAWDALCAKAGGDDEFMWGVTDLISELTKTGPEFKAGEIVIITKNTAGCETPVFFNNHVDLMCFVNFT